MQVLTNLTFIVSELSTYLQPVDHSATALSFLEMIVSMVNSKSILQANNNTSQNSVNSNFVSSRQNRYEDLLIFGCSAITALLKTLLSNPQTFSLVSESLLNKILLMMLSMESKKARESYTHGLNTVLA